MKKIIILLFVFLLPVPAFAGSRTQKTGEFYGKISGGLTAGSDIFENDGKITESEDLKLVSLDAYGELGFNERFTGTFRASLVTIADHGDLSTTTSGPFVLGLRYGVIQESLPVSLELRIGVDTGMGDKNLALGQNYRFAPGRTSGVFSEFLASSGWESGGFWIDGGAGLRGYSNGLGPDLIANLKVGFSFSDFEFSIRIPFNHALELDPIPNVAGVEATRYLGVGLGVGYWATQNIGLEVTAMGAVYANANIGAPALAIGAQFRGDLFD